MDNLQPHTSLNKIVSTVSNLSPGHLKFLNKSMSNRGSSELALSDQLSGLILKIKGDELETACSNYLWTCDQLKEEMLFFYREGKYRYSKLEDAIKHVYSNAEYMEKYLDGLLLTQVLWKNQFDAIFHLVEYFLKKISKPFRHLEVGPGHGLLLYLVSKNANCISAEGWDISESSLDHTRRSLDKLSSTVNVTLRQENAEQLDDIQSGKFDTVVISEVLEHTEAPVAVLENLKRKMNPNSLIFVNVPINSPALDHIYLLETTEQSVQLLNDAGFEIVESGFYPMVGYSLEAAIAQNATVSCVIVGRNA